MYISLLETHLRPTGRHVPCGIKQCYLPPDTDEREPQPCRPVLDLFSPKGWKAELTLVVGYIRRWFTCPQKVTHPGTNHLIATRPGVEPTTSRSQVQRPPLRHQVTSRQVLAGFTEDLKIILRQFTHYCVILGYLNFCLAMVLRHIIRYISALRVRY